MNLAPDGGFFRYGAHFRPAQMYVAANGPGGAGSGTVAVTKDMVPNSQYEPAVEGYVSDPLWTLQQKVMDLEQRLHTLANEIQAVRQISQDSITQAHKERDEMYALVEDLKEFNGQ